MPNEECISIKFPKGENVQFSKGKPVVILGANGSGKTRLSVKIEELNDRNCRNRYNPENFLVHRISAQKSLSLKNSILIKGLESSKREAFIGHEDPNASKYSYRYSGNPATKLLNDFDKSISLFFALNSKSCEDYSEACYKAKENGEKLPIPLKSLKRQAEEIWSYLLPNISLDLSGNEIHAKIPGKRYHGKEMSDGERVILYMIVQALSVDAGSLIIIDEPELHIHKAIVNKLWDKLEEVRPDCVFMYITHDLDFAVSRSVEEIIWVRSYDGSNNWDYEFLPVNDYVDLPEGLLFEIIGTQKKIIFVEGTKDSLDYLLYQEIYKDKDYHVIPCGGCSQVINYVKAKRAYGKLNHIEVCGIIDRDFRPQNELDSLKNDGIYSLHVAEVENLFLVPELFEVIREHNGLDKSVVTDAIGFILGIYKGCTTKQVLSAVSVELKHQLKISDFKQIKDLRDVEALINQRINKSTIKSIFDEKTKKFTGASKYKDILRVFNKKELSNSISSIFEKRDYKNHVINLMKRPPNVEIKQKIIKALKNYIPELP